MTAQFTKHFVQDLQQDIKIRQCGTIVFNTDNESNVITVDLYNGSEPYSGGGSVVGAVICQDGSTVPIDNGTLSGNTASITLTRACFAIPGQIGVGIQVVSGDVKTTVLKAIYNVELFETDTVVDPDERITISVGDLLQDIAGAIATIPADYSDLLATIAPTFSASTAYAAGQYVWYDGTLYRFTAAHSAGSWAGTDATAAVIGTDLSDLKSAITDITGNTRIEYTTQNAGYKNSTVGSTVTSTSDTNNFECTLISCTPGDQFTINGQGGATYRLWSFLDSSYTVLERETDTDPITGKIITAPANAAYLIINNHKVNRPNDYSYYGNIIRYSAVIGDGEFSHNGGATLSDADNAEPNKIYSVPTLTGTTHIPATGNLVTFAYNRSATINKSQLLLGSGGNNIYYRAKWNTSDQWSEWYKLNSNGYVYTVVPGGGGDFDSITEAIAEAVKHKNATVYIMPGVYDILDEYDELYGTGYIENHTFDASDRGNELYNGIHLVFDSGAFVKCNYTGSNATVNKFFSPFNISGSCKIENLNLTASNVRYAVHDENGGNNVPYHVELKRCVFSFDNHLNPNWQSKKVIGGGLGKYGDILIEDCYFHSVGLDQAGIESGIVTYHNNTSANSISHIVIRGCYFNESTFSARWYGNSTLITECICCNNSFAYAPWCGAETASSENENVVMHAWNNVVRT